VVPAFPSPCRMGNLDIFNFFLTYCIFCTYVYRAIRRTPQALSAEATPGYFQRQR